MSDSDANFMPVMIQFIAALGESPNSSWPVENLSQVCACAKCKPETSTDLENACQLRSGLAVATRLSNGIIFACSTSRIHQLHQIHCPSTDMRDKDGCKVDQVYSTGGKIRKVKTQKNEAT